MKAIFDVLERQSDYRIRTVQDSYEGTYVGREAGEGFSFVYFEGDCYRVTIVTRDDEKYMWADVTMTDGSHETLASMVAVDTIKPA